MNRIAAIAFTAVGDDDADAQLSSRMQVLSFLTPEVYSLCAFIRYCCYSCWCCFRYKILLIVYILYNQCGI